LTEYDPQVARGLEILQRVGQLDLFANKIRQPEVEIKKGSAVE
jgi:hypothetical protein